jgi:hypothetical protein
MALSFAGNGTIAGLSVGGLPDGTVDGDTLASGVGGKILQVVQVEKTDTWTSATNSFVDVTGMSLSITPSATSSKILILGHIEIQGGDGVTSQTKLIRDSTDINIGDAASSRTRATWNSSNQSGDIDGGNSLAVCFLDSPNSTSSLTYKISAKNNGTGGTIYLNRTISDSDAATRGRFASVLIAQEISA